MRVGPVPLANRFVLEQLRERFPELQPHAIDIKEALKGAPGVLVRNGFHTLLRYGPPLVRGERAVRDCFLRTPYLFAHVRRLVRARVDPDVTAFTFQTQSLFDASVPGVPHFVYTDHTNLANRDYPDGVASVYPAFWLDLEREIYANATRVFTRSAHVRRSLLRDYGVAPERVACVYAGPNVPAPPQPWRRDYRPKRVLFVGADWRRKGGPELVAAFRLVQRVHPDASLTVVGCSPRLDLPNARAVGRVPLAEVFDHYRDATVFCMPTRREPFGIAFVEAMSHALPVVATRVGALPDLVRHGDTGFLVEPGAVEALARRLVEVLARPELRRAMGRRGARLAGARYTWEGTGCRLARSVREACADV